MRNRLTLFVLTLAFASTGLQPLRAQDTIDADVCVYGGTSGGVTAAVQAARMGKRVVLVEPGRHLGGMTSGGLSAVDIGDPRSVGGIAREYFTRLVSSYRKQLNWGEAFQGHGGPATGGAYSIEPHVAERVFDELVTESGVIVLREARLKSVTKDGARVVALFTEDGRVVRAKMFLDTTYEGDLLAAASVTYTLQREGNAKYGETYNGIHYTDKYKPRTGHLQPGSNGRVKGGQGVWDRDFPLDPFIIKGDPSSGLLPLVNPGEPGTPGDPAPGIQAYCFRLCLTTDPANQIPIAPPADYDARQYEVVARFIEACLANGDDMDLRWFSKHDPLPNNKWDFNTATFGGNLPGLSWEWPEASYDRRVELAQQLEDYHRGLLHFLATDPRVPQKVRSDVKRFGLPKDEFTDNGGWPHQVYIREGRRMVSDLVLTEHHTFGRKVAPHSIGLGSYGTDTHEVRRIVKDGVVTREGKTATGRGGFGPYQIGYGAIVPHQSECENLLATFALSASHTAFSSIRMEPVFMVTSQSAATATCLAIDSDIPVQQLDYEPLRRQLLADGQVLHWSGQSAPARKITKPTDLPGIALDDTAAEYVGSWSSSNRQPSLLGNEYRHDNNQRKQQTATFTPDIPTAGEYEVRLLYTWHSNRSTKTPVTIHSADGETRVVLNQREPGLTNRVPKSLGTFRFDAGRQSRIVISNEGANGYVVVDGLQLVPVEIAKRERSGQQPSGFPEISMFDNPPPTKPAASNPRAAAVAFSPLAPSTIPSPPARNANSANKSATETEPAAEREPVLLAKPTPASQVDGNSFDVVVVGGTGGGVMCAVRAAREGCSVLLVQHNGHLGGMMTNGLMQWDALYGGPRSPLFNELLTNIENHYIAKFGRDSRDHQTIRYTHEHYPIGWAEPHVAEREYNRLVAAEPNITLLLHHYPTAVDRDGAIIRQVTLANRETANRETANRETANRETANRETANRETPDSSVTVAGTTFVDATYEGDLFALADVPYRVGREARNEYNEPHAGKVFANIAGGRPETVVAERLNIRPYSAHQGSIDPDSPFTADGAVQAYNYRFCVTSDPANRIPIEKPAGYRREEYLRYERRYIAASNGPNQKSHVNSPILPGENHAYPEADWPTRDRITQRHLDFGLGLMWFLQNDESIPEAKRADYRRWGLPKDEYADNEHVPYEMYVREARRIIGRHVFTEHDGMLAADYARTPIHRDSIAITDWYMDSHACSTDSRPGYHYDGKLILTNESRPSQIPYRSLLPRGVDNLLVPVCLSATHIAWGSIRLEPVFVQTGEATGLAAALAKQHRVTPADLDSDALVRELARRRQLVSFFNDVKVTAPDPVVVAAQYFATQGFFADYNARLNERLSESVAQLWDKAMAQLVADTLDPRQLARRIHEAESQPSPLTSQTRRSALLEHWRKLTESARN